MMNHMHVGTELRRIRKSRRLTLAQVKGGTDLSVSFLSDIERGRTNPSLETLNRLSRCYELPVNELLGTTGYYTNGNGNGKRVYPPGFRDFISQMGDTVSEEMQDLLIRVENHARQRAQSKDDWMRYYYSLMSILN